MSKSKWILILFIVLLALFIPSLSRMNDLRSKNADYAKQIEQLKIKNEQLKEELQLLRDDPIYLEKVAREKMGIGKEGEVIYKIETIKGDKE